MARRPDGGLGSAVQSDELETEPRGKRFGRSSAAGSFVRLGSAYSKLSRHAAVSRQWMALDGYLRRAALIPDLTGDFNQGKDDVSQRGDRQTTCVGDGAPFWKKL